MRLSEDGFGYKAVELWGNSITAWAGSEVETLTDYQYFFDENSALPEPAYSYELQNVITSYSIHYTKLYDG